MTHTFECSNREALVDYLYEECGPAERSAIAAHLIICSRCAAEVAALRATRAELGAWAPPHVHLGFRLVAESAPSNVIRPPRWWSRPMPAWAQAAAATLIFAAGLGLGVMRGGSGVNAPAGAGTVAANTTPAAAVSAGDLTALERRLRAEIAQARSVSAPPATASTAAGNAAVLQQVRQMIRESEVRQQQELSLRTAEVIRDFDTQRRGDLARIEQTFGRMEGTTSAEVEQQRQMLNYLMRVSQPQR
jgi:anti-sigma factor RsiW